jgi:hypothetical protein
LTFNVLPAPRLGAVEIVVKPVPELVRVSVTGAVPVTAGATLMVVGAEPVNVSVEPVGIVAPGMVKRELLELLLAIVALPANVGATVNPAATVSVLSTLIAPRLSIVSAVPIENAVVVDEMLIVLTAPVPVVVKLVGGVASLKFAVSPVKGVPVLGFQLLAVAQSVVAPVRALMGFMVTSS